MNAVDPGTFIYLGAGAAARHFGVPWWLIITGALGWELCERPLRRKAPDVFTHTEQDTVPNAIMDISAVVAGAALMEAWMKARYGR